MRYQVLGPLEVEASGGSATLGGPKQRLVLAMLLMQAGRVVSDDRLVDELWPDDAPERARHVIQTYVSELRRVLTDEIERAGAGYRLAVGREVIDAHRFESLMTAGRERVGLAPEGSAALLREALGLWHGEPYGGVADAPILRAEVHRLMDLRMAAVEDRVQADLAAGRHDLVVAELEALTREHPDRERLHALHMLALYRSGRQTDALRAYHRARAWLVEEMGLDPSPELQELERRILVQDPALRPPPDRSRGAVIGGRDAPAPDGLVAVRGFELRERVGDGRFGATYRAYQASVGREVAVKVFDPDLVRTPGFLRSFEPTARRVAELDHPNLLPLLDWWREADQACLVTPWIRAGDLERALRHGPLSLAATLRLADQVGGALEAAHQRGLVHGDLGPRNVLLDADGNALVADVVLVDAPAGRASREGGLAARSPEERRGARPTRRSDVWSLAVLLIQALTGIAPRADAPASGLTQRRVDAPADLVAVLAQASSVLPSDRHERVAELLRDLRRAAGTDVVAPVPDEVAAGRVRDPYKGLQAFGEEDAADFFGRASLVERLLSAVGAQRLVIVAGASGSGKSSVVNAGLLPALRAGRLPGSGEWLVTAMFPGVDPFEELARALLRLGLEGSDGLAAELAAGPAGLRSVVARAVPEEAQLLLVVDQLEELWSLTADAETRRAFLGCLVSAVRDRDARLRVVGTLRADFLDRALETHAVGEPVRDGLVLVTPPSPDELAEAVAGPAQQVGLRFESGLVDRIVRDVGHQPGGLPLLQHALSELVTRRDGRRLTTGGYEASGGVTGALGRRAETVYRDLAPRAQAVARQVFLRLVTVDEQHDDVRRRVRRGELGSLTDEPGLIDTVLREFGAHRLLAFDRDPVTRGPTVEVAHEALFSEWARLRDWIEARRADLLLHRRLRAAAAEWLAADRSGDYLVGGSRLAELEGWAAGTDLALTPGERAFLAVSRDREDAAAASRGRWRRLALLGTTSAAAVAVLLAAIAFGQLGRAEAGEREARARALAAASTTQLLEDQDLAVLLALGALDATVAGGGEPLVEAVDALHASLLAHRTLVTADVGGFFVGFAGEQGVFSAGPPRRQPTLWDPATGASIRTFESAGSAPIGTAVSADGRLAAETYFEAPVIVWDLAVGSVVARLGGPEQISWSPVFLPGGRLLALSVGQPDGSVVETVFDIASATVVSAFPLQRAGDVAFDPEGDWLAIADDRMPVVRLYDPMTGEWLATIGDPRGPGGVYSLALDPDRGRLAIYAIDPTRIEVFDVASRSLIGRIPVSAQPNRVCFAGGGALVVATAADTLTHVFDVESGVEVLTLPGTGHLDGLDCAPDGRRVVVSGDKGTARIFDLGADAGGEVASFPVADPWAGSWDPDGTIRVVDASGSIARFDPSGRSIARRSGLAPGAGTWTARSPDGRLIAVDLAGEAGHGDPAITLLDATTLAPVKVLDGDGLPLAFSPDGRLLLAGAHHGVASIFDVASGARVVELPSPLGIDPYDSPAGLFLPDGRHVIVKDPATPRAWVFGVDGRFVGSICSEADSLAIRLDPSAERLVIADLPGAVEAWAVDGLLGAVAGSGPDCVRDGPDPSDSDRVQRITTPGADTMHLSSDGRLLALSSTYAGTLSVVDAVTGERRFALEHRGEIAVLGFSPDSRRLAVAFRDTRGGRSLSAVRIYALDPDDVARLAASRVTRAPSQAECAGYPGLWGCPE